MSTIHSILLASLLATEAERHDLAPELLEGPAWEFLEVEPEALALEAAHEAVRGVLTRVGFDAHLSSRLKSAESRHDKAARKGVSEADLLDRLALRVVVPTEAECDEVRSELLDHFELVAGSEDDYIRNPKANGYQSLHMALRLQPVGEVFEVQVRTPEMHAHAEHGGASHVAYKAAMAHHAPESSGHSLWS